MGLLRNYRWLKARDVKAYPKPDFAKKAATDAEISVCEALRNIEGVVDVYHSARIDQIISGKSRREADIIVLMHNRIVFIEVKNYKGDITMEENVLLQNGQSRGWTFAKLEEAVGRFHEISRHVGIRIQQDVIETVLACVGFANVDASVKPRALTGSFVAESTDQLLSILSVTEDHHVDFDEETLKALKTLLSMFGTWDAMQFPNEAQHEGDLIQPRDKIREWRITYQALRVRNERTWWGTFFRGPKFVGDLIPRLGDNIVTVDLDYMESAVLHNPHERIDEEYTFEDVASLVFGYKEVPDWNKVKLMEPKVAETKREKVVPTPQEGDVIPQARVLRHLTEGAHQGIVFRLDEKNEGVLWRDQMSIMEWDNKDMLMAVNSAHDVEVTSSTYNKTRKSWRIKVKTI
ncbi:MAG TPA: NERD domain-containing protein [Candidatus Poseidoniaceae archaeon]|nr:MAG TPA: NERD domain-containing protein [Candidatus Poseidoniales archaeon]HII96554.1 NERD domain-containing protein [Candidatus Poseidoniaceae archaeon]